MTMGVLILYRYPHLPEIVKIVGVEYLGTLWELCIPTIVGGGGIEYSMPGGWDSSDQL
jgi:hypothetical protein